MQKTCASYLFDGAKLNYNEVRHRTNCHFILIELSMAGASVAAIKSKPKDQPAPAFENAPSGEFRE